MRNDNTRNIKKNTFSLCAFMFGQNVISKDKKNILKENTDNELHRYYKCENCNAKKWAVFVLVAAQVGIF